MSIQRYILRLYPHTWRERYEDEVLAMLEQRSLSFTDGVNLLFGALDARLHPYLGTTGLSLYERMKQMLSLLRRSLLVMFCASSAFILAGAGFQKMNEEELFRFALLLSIPATISMALILVAMLIWGLSLHGSVPQLFNSNEGIFGSSTPANWLGIIIAMTITTVIAAVSLIRGLSARSALRNAPA